MEARKIRSICVAIICLLGATQVFAKGQVQIDSKAFDRANQKNIRVVAGDLSKNEFDILEKNSAYPVSAKPAATPATTTPKKVVAIKTVKAATKLALHHKKNAAYRLVATNTSVAKHRQFAQNKKHQTKLNVALNKSDKKPVSKLDEQDSAAAIY